MKDRVDIIAGTVGKALGGASGRYVSARREIVELLRQWSRPNLFSNAAAPSAFDVLDGDHAMLEEGVFATASSCPVVPQGKALLSLCRWPARWPTHLPPSR